MTDHINLRCGRVPPLPANGSCKWVPGYHRTELEAIVADAEYVEDEAKIMVSRHMFDYRQELARIERLPHLTPAVPLPTRDATKRHRRNTLTLSVPSPHRLSPLSTVLEDSEAIISKPSLVRFDLDRTIYYEHSSLTPEPSPNLQDQLYFSALGLDWFAEAGTAPKPEGLCEIEDKCLTSPIASSTGSATGDTAIETFQTPSPKSVSLARVDSSQSSITENNILTPPIPDHMFITDSASSTHSKHIFWADTTPCIDANAFDFFGRVHSPTSSDYQAGSERSSLSSTFEICKVTSKSAELALEDREESDELAFTAKARQTTSCEHKRPILRRASGSRDVARVIHREIHTTPVDFTLRLPTKRVTVGQQAWDNRDDELAMGKDG